MPSYNHVAFVGEAIESVLSQSFEDFELVITDDGSDDGTVAVIERFKDPRIRLEVFPANRGAAKAANCCIQRARGEFIALLNSDDFFLPEKLDVQVRFLSNQPDLAAVFSQVRFVDECGHEIQRKQNPFDGLFSTVFPNRYGWLQSFFFRGNGLCHPTMLIRRTIYQELGVYDPSLLQLYDFDMWVRLCACYEIRIMPDLLVGYRVLTNGGNASAPGPTVFRRTAWEHTRVRHRYRLMDEDTLYRTFGDVISAAVAARGLPMALQLALTAGAMESPQLQLFALETLQDAVERGVSGVGPKDLHALTGAIDPLRQIEFDAMRQAITYITQQRDQARLQVEGLAGYLKASIAALQTGDGDKVADDMTHAMAAFRATWSA